VFGAHVWRRDPPCALCGSKEHLLNSPLTIESSTPAFHGINMSQCLALSYTAGENIQYILFGSASFVMDDAELHSLRMQNPCLQRRERFRIFQERFFQTNIAKRNLQHQSSLDRDDQGSGS